jgi:tRNA pseudouridine32 synthase/23S rRNA pseudouridine746 synthase
MSTRPCSSEPDAAGAPGAANVHLAGPARPRDAADRALIIFADDAWIVLDKPAGLPAVPGRAEGLQDCAASRAQSVYADARVVHRLDMPTSGLLLMARGLQRQRRLSQAFAQRAVDKRYVAVVTGELAEDAGEIHLPLSPDWPQRPRQRVDTTGGKPSLTRWQVIARAGDRTRLLLTPVTGRTHQLRVHLGAIGHAIVGDMLYAPDGVAAAASRLMLHAWTLTAPHPDTGATARFESPVPF